MMTIRCVSINSRTRCGSLGAWMLLTHSNVCRTGHQRGTENTPCTAKGDGLAPAEPIASHTN